MSISIVLNHRDFVIIDKPADISVQLEQGQEHKHALLTQVCQQLKLPKLWLVHRLDKLTSGLLILAKSAEAAATLSELFALRQVQKFYLALSDKNPKKKQGTISGDMKKVRDGKWILQQQKTNPAVSQFFTQGLGDGLRLFVIRPHTGKTHQIRVALKSLGSPILGDTLYGGQPSDRGYLHAFALNFTYQGDSISVSRPPQSGDLFCQSACVDGIAHYDPPSELAWPKIKTPLQPD